MRWKAKYTKADYKEGATRLKRAFSWLPTYIGGVIVWLEVYEVLQVYVVTNQKAIIDDEEANFNLGSWVNLSKRICQ